MYYFNYKKKKDAVSKVILQPKLPKSAKKIKLKDGKNTSKPIEQHESNINKKVKGARKQANKKGVIYN